MVCTMMNIGKRRPRMASVPVEFIGDHSKGRAPIRNLILATKAYQAVDAVESILPSLSQRNPNPTSAQNESTSPLRIFILSNGALDVRDNLQRLLQSHKHDNIPSPEWILCTTTHGVVKEESDHGGDDDDMEPMIHLTHVGIGRTFLGGHPPMTRLWDQSGLQATLMENSSTHKNEIDPMEILLWKKLAGNCFCNPLTALWEVTNGELMKQDRGPKLRQQVVSEVSQVAKALHPTWSESNTNISEDAIDAFVEQVIQDNLHNRSSMYYDVKSGRRTEIDSLNGFIVRHGKNLGIDTPANEELFHAIQSITPHGIP